MKLRRGSFRGFTLIESMMVIVLLAVLAAIAIPNFLDFRTDAKNAATQDALGKLRTGVAIAVASIQLREDPASSPPKYPTHAEMVANKFLEAHPVLAAKGESILESGSAIPRNPWTLSTLPDSEFSSIEDCTGKNKGETLGPPRDNRGWCYDPTNGNLWANSAANGAPNGGTENGY